MRRNLAAALVLLALASCTGGGAPSASRPPTLSPPTSSSTPSVTSTLSLTSTPRFKVIDSTWVGADTGWVLGAGTCGAKACVSLLTTINGGQTWRKVAAPGGPPSAALTGECEDPCVTHVRFANGKVGYAFGPGFFVTRDGARTWRRESARLVVNIEISRGRAFRVVSRMTGCPGPCDVRIEISNVGSRTWRDLPAPEQGGVGTGLVVQGDRVYLAANGNPAGGAGDAHTRFSRSRDGGRTWDSFSDPCGHTSGSENDAVSYDARAGFFAALCQSRQFSERRNFVVASFDSAESFGPRHSLPEGSPFMIAAGSSDILAVAMIRKARYEVITSRDGGGTWRTTLRGPSAEGVDGPFFLGFQNASTARVAFSGRSIWTTRDAGATWTRSDPF